MTIKELGDLMFENYYREIGFTKKAVIIQWNVRRKKIYYHLQQS